MDIPPNMKVTFPAGTPIVGLPVTVNVIEGLHLI